jgi:hypothetical protein
MKKFKVGDCVTPTIEREAYDYARSPHVIIKPGMIGVVAKTDVPAVHPTSTGKELVFYCVDFVVPGCHAFCLEKNPPIWRCNFYDGELTPTDKIPDVGPLLKYVGHCSADEFVVLVKGKK